MARSTNHLLHDMRKNYHTPNFGVSFTYLLSNANLDSIKHSLIRLGQERWVIDEARQQLQKGGNEPVIT